MTTSAGQQNKSDKRPLLFAAVLGIVAAILVLVVLNSSDDSSKAEPAVASRSVVVALQDIAPGVRITAAMVEIRQVPENVLAKGAIPDLKSVLGQRVRYPLAEGEQLTTLRLVESAPVQALSFQIPQGMRGMTIPVSSSQSPSAVLAPGDFVDLLLSAPPSRLQLQGSPPLTAAQAANQDVANAVATLLQNVQVISVAATYVADGVEYEASTRGSPPTGGVGFVTLSVTPEQAQVLTLALERGTLTFVLRPFGDEKLVPLTPFREPFIIPLIP